MIIKNHSKNNKLRKKELLVSMPLKGNKKNLRKVSLKPRKLLMLMTKNNHPTINYKKIMKKSRNSQAIIANNQKKKKIRRNKLKKTTKNNRKRKFKMKIKNLLMEENQKLTVRETQVVKIHRIQIDLIKI